MRKTILCMALLTVGSSAVATEIYNGRSSGMAGTGYAIGGYSDGVLLNPSLVARHKDTDSFALVLNGGALGADKDDLIDGLEDLVDFTDYLSDITDISELDESDAEELKRLMRDVDNKTVHATFGGSLVLAIPNSYLSAALVAKATGSVGVLADIDEDDYELIDNSVEESFEPEDLQSSVLGRGVIVEELGIALAKNISRNETHQILLGITPKRVEVETIVYEATVADYDEDDIDGDDYKVSASTTSVDAGITYISGNLSYGLALSNISSKKFKTISNDKYELATRTTAAVGYTGSWFKAETSLDLDAVPTFGLGGDSQLFRVGVELAPISWLQLRAGIQRDLEDTMPDAYSLGIGLSPFDVVNIDIAGFTGSDETVGGALQLGLRF